MKRNPAHEMYIDLPLTFRLAVKRGLQVSTGLRLTRGPGLGRAEYGPACVQFALHRANVPATRNDRFRDTTPVQAMTFTTWRPWSEGAGCREVSSFTKRLINDGWLT